MTGHAIVRLRSEDGRMIALRLRPGQFRTLARGVLALAPPRATRGTFHKIHTRTCSKNPANMSYPLMEFIAPLLLAILFIVFGLSYRSGGGCDGCTGRGGCHGQAGCPQQRDESGG
jgi:hypothetical protein